MPPTTPTVVIATRDRLVNLRTTLQRLRALPERPPIIVVDNGSSDGTARAVAAEFPDVECVPLRENRGSAGRNVGVERAATPYVAFSDDDSWWRPGSLAGAARFLDDHPPVGLLAAQVLVEPLQRLDNVCLAMARSPLPPDGLSPGRPVLGFLACGAVVRRKAYLEAGGFHARYGVGGEETLLALDLVCRGWRVRYVPSVVAHHNPQARRVSRPRNVDVRLRNRLWSAWLRFPLSLAASSSVREISRGWKKVEQRRALAEAAKGLPWVLRERRVIPASVARDIRRLAGRRPG